MSGTAAAVGSADGLDLVASLKAGDEQAFAALVDGWSGWMLRLAREHVASHAIAEEVVQETWLAVLRGLDGFRGEASLRTWVYRILANQAKRRGVREQRTIPFASLTSDDEGPTVDPARFRGPEDQYPGGWRTFPEEWPEQMTLTREVHEVVAAALTDLPDRQRAVVALRDLDGLTSEEVCDLLDISAGNQRVLLHRGRAAVRAHLERYLTGSPATRSESTGGNR
jgi:RNA polymerase sigma-70 factor, ECF subfamily